MSDQTGLLFPIEWGGVLRDGDREVLAGIEDEVRRGRAEMWVFWWRRNSHKMAAGAAAVRRLIGGGASRVAPLHMACEMRQAAVRAERVPIGIDAAVFLARVLALTMPEFGEVFDFRKSAAADALFAAGWVP